MVIDRKAINDKIPFKVSKKNNRKSVNTFPLEKIKIIKAVGQVE